MSVFIFSTVARRLSFRSLRGNLNDFDVCLLDFSYVPMIEFSNALIMSKLYIKQEGSYRALLRRADKTDILHCGLLSYHTIALAQVLTLEMTKWRLYRQTLIVHCPIMS